MIIDCHGHYTTAPAPLGDWRAAQTAAVARDPAHVGEKGTIAIGDDEIRESLEGPQLAEQRRRGTDLTLFSPRASWMGHHVGNVHTSRLWSEHCNELVRRACDLEQGNFAPVCQLPQSPDAAIDVAVRELARCVDEMGFVGCNLNPDPSGGYWTGPPLGDRYWYHVSASCNPHFHTTGAHYLAADTAAFVQLLTSDVLADLPELRLIVPHGGGAVPYHWGRFRGLVQDMGKPPLDELVLGNVFFDTCVYHQAGIDCLLAVVPVDNVLFASEMIGAVRGVDPRTGHHYDDTRRYVDASGLGGDDRHKVYEANARRVFPRLSSILGAPA